MFQNVNGLHKDYVAKGWSGGLFGVSPSGSNFLLCVLLMLPRLKDRELSCCALNVLCGVFSLLIEE